MQKLLIKNGVVFDPLNGIEGETKDLLIEEGYFVENFSSNEDVKEIDATGKTVIPAGIDIHTHISSPALNWVRLLGKEIESFKESWNGLTLFQIAQDYIKNGYTFICEANVLPSLSKQTLFDFSNLPVLDTSFLLNVSNLWPLEGEYLKNRTESAAIFIADLLSKTKAFGIKVYNPFESESWNFNDLRENIESKGKLYDFSALDVYKTLVQVNELLDLPHSLHAHIEGYESKYGTKNVKRILESIKSLDLKRKNSQKSKREQIFHLAHANSYYLNESNSELIEFYNKNQDFDLDFGFLGFDEINPLITSDRRLISNLRSNEDFNYKILSSAMEFEGDSYVSFRHFQKDNISHFNLWANAIHLALEVKNKWQLQLSLNFPHYSKLTNIPFISSFLLSGKARKKEFDSIKGNFNHDLLNNNKELSFNDYVIITRASPAKSLGISHIKGNLGIAADGDVNILNIDMNNIDPHNQYQQIIDALRDMEYVIKDGNVIKKDESYDFNFNGKTFYSEGNTKFEEKSQVLKKKKEFYQKYYSIFYESLNSEQRKGYLKKI
jgi:formylmethanofuran dehydrogenase subunit A